MDSKRQGCISVNLVKLLSSVRDRRTMGISRMCSPFWGHIKSSTTPPVPPEASFGPRYYSVMSLLLFVLHNYDSVGRIIDGIAYKEYYRRVLVPFWEWNIRKTPTYGARRRKRVPAIQESPIFSRCNVPENYRKSIVE